MNFILSFLKSIFSPGSTSEQWSINVHDFAKGLFIAALSTPLTIVMQSLESGHFTIEWSAIWKVALVGAFSYLIKNFFTPTK